MKTLFQSLGFTLTLLVSSTLWAQPAANAASVLVHSNLGKNVLGVKGYDLVSYFNAAEPLEGKKSIVLTHEGVTYRFANEENKALFVANPTQYIPAFGGWCAWAMLEGSKTDINPKSFKIFDGRLFLFYDGLWGDTRKLWNEKAQSESEEALAATASEMWAAILKK